jgi:ParB-like chromosome segregation protein Spo0J
LGHRYGERLWLIRAASQRALMQKRRLYDHNDRKVAHLPIRDLRPNPNNARTHSRQQIEQIARSIDQFGFTNPVLIDSSNQILAGHGRVEGAKLLGVERIPTLRIEHLTDAEKRAYVIADNKLAEKAGWSNDMLKIELQELIKSGFRSRIDRLQCRRNRRPSRRRRIKWR